jgi:hypothetical protein
MKVSVGHILPCKTTKQAQCTQYQSAIEYISRGHGGNVLDGGEVIVVWLGGADNEIECGGGFALQNQKLSAARSVLVCYKSN